MEKVYFIGAGPGDPELITVKGQRIVKEADVIIYAGSLVPKEVINCHKDGAERKLPEFIQETLQFMGHIGNRWTCLINME